MKEMDKALQGVPYNGSEDELTEERNRVRDLYMAYNLLNPGREGEKAAAILRKLFARMGKNFMIMPPIYVDYGSNVEIGDNFFSNYNLTILDCAKVTIGNNVLIAPNVGLYAAGHPLSASQRAAGLEYAKPITIGDHVWIGGSVSVMPGVTIGSCTVIGGGSVVVHDIPSGVLAAGNPCRIIRELTPEERSLPVANVERSLPVANVERSLPVANVERSLPVANVERSLPVANVEPSLPVANVEPNLCPQPERIQACGKGHRAGHER